MSRNRSVFGLILTTAILSLYAACDGPERPDPPPTPTTTLAPPVEPPPPSYPPAEVRLPAVCASYYASPTDPDLDVQAFASRLAEMGIRCTRGWLLDAWALGERYEDGTFKEGQYDGWQPVRKRPDGRYDFAGWNEGYWDHLRDYVETLNRYGIWPHLSTLDLYTWSDRKAGLQWVPDVTKNLFRFNVDGPRWGDPDDATFEALPDRWMRSYLCKIVVALDGTVYALEIGNEMPERPMHWRIGDHLRGPCGYDGLLTVNRQIDSPGQYWNMEIGSRYGAISYHGKRTIEYLDEEFPEEAGAGRPTTFRAAWPMYDAAAVFLSSDGSRKSTNVADAYDYAALDVVFRDALDRGASVEHQLALKLRRFTGNPRRLDLGDLVYDEPFLRGLTGR